MHIKIENNNDRVASSDKAIYCKTENVKGINVENVALVQTTYNKYTELKKKK
jgi:hypothetical protein